MLTRENGALARTPQPVVSIHYTTSRKSRSSLNPPTRPNQQQCQDKQHYPPEHDLTLCYDGRQSKVLLKAATPVNTRRIYPIICKQRADQTKNWCRRCARPPAIICIMFSDGTLLTRRSHQARWQNSNSPISEAFITRID